MYPVMHLIHDASSFQETHRGSKKGCQKNSKHTALYIHTVQISEIQIFMISCLKTITQILFPSPSLQH